MSLHFLVLIIVPSLCLFQCECLPLPMLSAVIIPCIILLQYGYECFCGNDPSSFVYMPESECNFLCEGAQTEACGAGNRLTAFKYGKYFQMN